MFCNFDSPQENQKSTSKEKAPKEWGDLIYEWYISIPGCNRICTFQELQEGEDVRDQPWYGIDGYVLFVSLKYLEFHKKVVFFEGLSNHFHYNFGIKFLRQ